MQKFSDSDKLYLYLQLPSGPSLGEKRWGGIRGIRGICGICGMGWDGGVGMEVGRGWGWNEDGSGMRMEEDEDGSGWRCRDGAGTGMELGQGWIRTEPARG